MGCAFLKDFINSSEGSLNGTRIRGRESGTLNNPSPVMRSRSMMERFMRNRERAQISASDSISPSTRLLLRAPFSNFSCFSQQIYLTGWGGITLDNLKQYNIKGLFNVTYEINDPLSGIKNPSIEHHKYPIIDSYTFSVYDYFDKAVDQMNLCLKARDGNVTVFCSAGMSRSSTFVLAYAIRYLKMSLKEAFIHLQEIRPYARPNLSFFSQLVQYEYEKLGCNTVEMVRESMDFESCTKNESETKKQKKKKDNQMVKQYLTVPDLYRKEFPNLLKLEISEAKRVPNHPMVSESKSTTGSVMSTSGINKCPNPRTRTKSNQNKSSEKSAFLNNELKPFVVENVSYENFVLELESARNQRKNE